MLFLLSLDKGLEASSEGKLGVADSQRVVCQAHFRPSVPALPHQHEDWVNEINKGGWGAGARLMGGLPARHHSPWVGGLVGWLPAAWATYQWHFLRTEQPPQRVVRDRRASESSHSAPC